MINEENARLYCCEDISLIRGYERAVNDTTQVYDLHHLEGVFYTEDEMKSLGKYWKQPAMALIFLTKSEHLKIHLAFNPQWAEKSAKARSKPVYQYTLDGGFVKKWPSLSHIVRSLNYSKGNICRCCRGKRKQAYGYIWRYAE